MIVAFDGKRGEARVGLQHALGKGYAGRHSGTFHLAHGKRSVFFDIGKAGVLLGSESEKGRQDNEGESFHNATKVLHFNFISIPGDDSMRDDGSTFSLEGIKIRNP